MTWCVVTGVWRHVRAQPTLSVIHLMGLRMVTIMSDSEGLQAGADWHWVCVTYYIWLCSSKGSKSVMSLPDDTDVTSIFFLHREEGCQLSGCEWTPSSGGADKLYCRASVCFSPSSFQGNALVINKSLHIFL